MSNRIESGLAALLTAWVRFASRRAWPVICLSLISAVVLAFYVVEEVGVNTDATDMISEELEFRQVYKAYKGTFESLANPILVVIDGETPDLAYRAAQRLGTALESDPENFEKVDWPGGGDFFDRNGLLYQDVDEIYDLGDRLSSAQPLLAELVRDESLRGLFAILSDAAEAIADGEEEPDPELVRVVQRLSSAIERILAGQTTYFSWQEIISGEDSDTGDRRRFLAVQPAQDYGNIRPSEKAISALRDLIESLGPDSGVTVRLTGPAVLADEELAGISEDAGLASSISFVLVALILFIGLRSPQVATASLITMVIGLIWTAAFAVAVVGDFNMISIAFAVLFIGLSIDLNIHFGLRFREGIVAGVEPRGVLVKIAGGIGWALALAVVSDAIAFYSFIPTAYAGIAELGLIAGTGMFIAFVATMTLMPALLTIIPIRARPSVETAGSRGAAIHRLIRRNAVPIAGLAAILGLISLYGAQNVRFDFDPINLRDPTTESVQTFRDLEADPDSTTYNIRMAEPDLATALAVAERLETLATVKRAVTLQNFIPDDQDDKLAAVDDLSLIMIPVFDSQVDALPTPTTEAYLESSQRLAHELGRVADADTDPEMKAAARRLATVLDSFLSRASTDPSIIRNIEDVVLDTLPDQLHRLRLSLSAKPVGEDDLPAILRESYLAPTGEAKVRVDPEGSMSDPAEMAAFVEEVRTVAPNATGGPVLILESGRAIVDAFITASLIATIVISLFLMFLLRSVTDAVMILTPLVLAALLTLATAAFLGQPFNFATIIVLPLLIGLGVDSGIHMVMRERAMITPEKLMETSTPRAVVLSALTTICSFGSLMVSGHQGTASMGQLLTLALFYSLITTLIVLPALLAIRTRIQSR